MKSIISRSVSLRNSHHSQLNELETLLRAIVDEIQPKLTVTDIPTFEAIYEHLFTDIRLSQVIVALQFTSYLLIYYQITILLELCG